MKRFQKADLPEAEQEWHKLVPPEAMDALGKQEVQRQSVIFEVIKSERDYVADLRSIQDVRPLHMHVVFSQYNLDRYLFMGFGMLPVPSFDQQNLLTSSRTSSATSMKFCAFTNECFLRYLNVSRNSTLLSKACQI